MCVQKLPKGITLNCVDVCDRESGQQLPREITIRDNYVGPCVLLSRVIVCVCVCVSVFSSIMHMCGITV